MIIIMIDEIILKIVLTIGKENELTKCCKSINKKSPLNSMDTADNIVN